MKSRCVAFLIIGNEILSGRTAEKNLQVLASLLNERGLRLGEVRIVPDIADDIAAALNALRGKADFVFTSGGIGPTHDDITNDSIALALSLPVVEDPAAIEKLRNFYAQRGEQLTAARRRMARLPKTAAVIDGDYPGAPAYRVENVIVCAGVPAIFRRMAVAACAGLPQGEIRQSAALHIDGGESLFAEALAKLAAEFSAVEIGSYPRENDGKFFCEVVFSADSAAVAEIGKARDAFSAYLTAENIPHRPLA